MTIEELEKALYEQDIKIQALESQCEQMANIVTMIMDSIKVGLEEECRLKESLNNTIQNLQNYLDGKVA